MELLSSGSQMFLLIIIMIILLPVVALIDILRSQFTSPENKVIWVIVVLMLPFIGPILFWLIGRSQKVKDY